MITRFDKVKFSITNACECKCKFCYRSSEEIKKYIPFDIIKKTLIECISVGINKIHISGGNPMLHPDFDRILNYIFTLNYPIKLSTTVTHLTPKLLTTYINNGLSELALSLNSSNAKEHDDIRGFNGDFDKTIKLIKFLKNTKLKIIITFVITNYNLHHIEKLFHILSFGKNIFIKFQLIEFSLTPQETLLQEILMEYKNLKLLYGDIFPNLFKEADNSKISIAPAIITKFEFDKKLQQFSKGIYANAMNDRAYCQYMLFNPHIKEDCLVYPCCGNNSERVIGDLTNQNILEIYSSHIKKFLTHNGLPYKSCKHCIFYSYYNRLGNDKK